MASTPPIPPDPIPPDWPPPWLKTVAFGCGLALMTWEAVVEHSAHIVVYGPAFAMTGLRLATGVESLLMLIGDLFKGVKK